MNHYLVLFGRNVKQELPVIIGYMEAQVDQGNFSEVIWGDFSEKKFLTLQNKLGLDEDSKIVVAKVVSDYAEISLPFLQEKIQKRFGIETKVC